MAILDEILIWNDKDRTGREVFMSLSLKDLRELFVIPTGWHHVGFGNFVKEVDFYEIDSALTGFESSKVIEFVELWKAAKKALTSYNRMKSKLSEEERRQLFHSLPNFPDIRNFAD